MSEPVDILDVLPPGPYDEAGYDRLNRRQESLEATCVPDSYRSLLDIAPPEGRREKLNDLLINSEVDVVILTDDCVCQAAGWIERFQGAKAMLPRAGILCGKVSEPGDDGPVLRSAGYDLLTGGGLVFPWAGRPDPGTLDYAREVAAVNLVGCYLTREFLDDVGRLDLALPEVGGDGPELALRAWRASWRVWYVPGPHLLRDAPEEPVTGATWGYLLERYTHPFYEHIRRDKLSVVAR